MFPRHHRCLTPVDDRVDDRVDDCFSVTVDDESRLMSFARSQNSLISSLGAVDNSSTIS